MTNSSHLKKNWDINYECTHFSRHQLQHWTQASAHSTFLSAYSKRMLPISQRKIISFLAFITPMGLILFTHTLDGLDTPSASHTKIEKHAKISLWHDMNLSTHLANYGAFALKSITFPPSAFAISPSLCSHHYINPARRPPLLVSSLKLPQPLMSPSLTF